MLYDVFISHASEDKDVFVRPLAEQLRAAHIEVWYDEFSLRVGDGLRSSIDRGLRQSRFGIVVLSPHFFNKQWSQWELDGLVARQMAGAENLILPIWLDVGRSDVLDFSPSLADKLAIGASSGMDEVVRCLTEVIRPQGSTLVVARDFLLARGFVPPVISDDWWLDVAAASEANDMEGGFQEAMGWGRWGFPLPPATNEATQRGTRLGWAALQRNWLYEAADRPITQITPPTQVLDFIENQIGLTDTCRRYPHYLLTYAPQLTIPGLGGSFEPVFEKLYLDSLAHQDHLRQQGSLSGSGLTTSGQIPCCSEELAFRHPDFGDYEPASVACAFVQGSVNGPPVKYYSTIDYLAWLLSESSQWLGSRVRAFLTDGIVEWGVWIWDGNDQSAEINFGYQPDAAVAGSFGEALTKARSIDTVRIGRKARQDLVHRLDFSARLLDLPEGGEQLAALAADPQILHHYFEHRADQRKRR